MPEKGISGELLQEFIAIHLATEEWGKSKNIASIAKLPTTQRSHSREYQQAYRPEGTGIKRNLQSRTTARAWTDRDGHINPPDLSPHECQLQLYEEEWKNIQKDDLSLRLFARWFGLLFATRGPDYKEKHSLDPKNYELHSSPYGNTIMQLNMGRLDREAKQAPADVDRETQKACRSKRFHFPKEFRMVLTFICNNSAHQMIVQEASGLQSADNQAFLAEHNVICCFDESGCSACLVKGRPEHGASIKLLHCKDYPKQGYYAMWEITYGPISPHPR